MNGLSTSCIQVLWGVVGVCCIVSNDSKHKCYASILSHLTQSTAVINKHNLKMAIDMHQNVRGRQNPTLSQCRQIVSRIFLTVPRLPPISLLFRASTKRSSGVIDSQLCTQSSAKLEDGPQVYNV